MGRSTRALALFGSLLLWLSAGSAMAEPDVAALEELGKQVFFDKISSPPVMACATCHVSAAGWTAGSSAVNQGQVAVPGAIPTRAGQRKPPSSAYATFAPAFGDSFLPGGCATPGLPGIFCKGGIFWDGRATGRVIGEEVFAGNAGLKEAYEAYLGPAADQALGPFGNDVEQNVPDGNDNGLPGAEFVCRHVKKAHYAGLYKRAWGETPDCEPSGVDISFKRIAVAISAWEHSPEVNSFSSRRDRALACDNDDTPNAFPLRDFTDRENLGHDLFYGITSKLNPSGKNAGCAVCHSSGGPGSAGNEPEELYTDHSFHHLGLPPNYDIPRYDPDFPDLGLANHTATALPEQSGHAGHFKTPTLRNVGKRPSHAFTKAYMHNGYFKTLEDVVHFYNTALVKLDPIRCPAGTTAKEARARDCWPAPEVDNGLQASLTGLFGDLGLSDKEEAAIVAYLKTLSDTETVRDPNARRPHTVKRRAKRAKHHAAHAPRHRPLLRWFRWFGSR